MGATYLCWPSTGAAALALVAASTARMAARWPSHGAPPNREHRSCTQVTELVPLAFLPPFLLRRKVLRPMATMAGGTMMAAALAMERGWAINLGGGMHHASHDQGGGWCPYADIHLAIRRLRAASGGGVRRVMVVDLDVHQVGGSQRGDREAEALGPGRQGWPALMARTAQ